SPIDFPKYKIRLRPIILTRHKHSPTFNGDNGCGRIWQLTPGGEVANIGQIKWLKWPILADI
ncbi:MAG: hypothetical protein P8Y60_20925, partial [Calditrichota bacterium]